jgi:hypothetical protein
MFQDPPDYPGSHGSSPGQQQLMVIIGSIFSIGVPLRVHFRM